MKKKILSILLAATIIISSVTPTVVNASSKKNTTISKQTILSDMEQKELQESKKSNFIFIKTTDISDIQYSYEQDGKKYLVKENSNSDLSNINTEIYEIIGEEDVLVTSYNTTIEKNDDTLVVTKNEDNCITSEVIDLDGGSLDVNTVTAFSRNPVSGTYSGALQYDYTSHKYYTMWFNTGSDTGYNVINGTSLSVVIAIIGGIAATNPAIAVSSAIITPIATAIVSSKIQTLYWSKTYQDLWEVTYPGKQYIGWAVGVRTYTTFYSNSSRSNQIGNTVLDEYHDPQYWPSNMNF